MNSKKIYFSLFSTICLLLITAQSSYAASAKVMEITGSVFKYSADGANMPVTEGAILKQGDSISVTALSQAKLVFSNGSEVTVEENTSVNIAKLEQAAFGGGKTYEQLEADPSQSQTLLELNYGELTGHVKQLQSGSRFDIETPLGTAAIRGTTFAVLLSYNAEREEFLLVVNNLDGLVEIISRYVGEVNYGAGNVGDKGYDSGLSDDVIEPIPEDHIVVIRLHRNDPYFDDIFDLIKNYIPDGPKPVITQGSPFTGEDDEDESDDFGIIVVSPEGPLAPSN